MLIFNVANRKATVGKNKGKTVYYAQAAPTQRLTSRTVEDMIMEKTSLSRGDVRHAITSLAEIVRWGLSEGIAVDLADLGSFKVEAHGKLMTNEADVNAGSIKSPVIRFFPRQEMRKQAKSVAITVRNPLAQGLVDKPRSGEATSATASPSAGGASSSSDSGTVGADSGSEL